MTEWIKTTDKLPQIHTEVLILYNGIHRRVAWMPTDPPVRLRSDSGASNARAD